MKVFDVKEMVESKSPGYFSKKPWFVEHAIIKILDYFFHTDQINDFLHTHGNERGMAFLDAVLARLDFGFDVTDRELVRIPESGKLIIAANHPLGALDGICLIKAVSRVRRDVRIVVYDIFMKFDALKEFFLPYDGYTRQSQQAEFLSIRQALENEAAVIFFPAGEVSRLTWTGICDSNWKKGPVHFARELNAPVLPVYIHARNSWLFYLTSLFSINLSSFMLAHESIIKESGSLKIRIGPLIPGEVFINSPLLDKQLTSRLRTHTCMLWKHRNHRFQP